MTHLLFYSNYKICYKNSARITTNSLRLSKKKYKFCRNIQSIINNILIDFCLFCRIFFKSLRIIFKNSTRIGEESARNCKNNSIGFREEYIQEWLQKGFGKNSLKKRFDKNWSKNVFGKNEWVRQEGLQEWVRQEYAM